MNKGNDIYGPVKEDPLTDKSQHRHSHNAPHPLFETKWKECDSKIAVCDREYF